MCEYVFTPNKSKSDPNPQPKNCTRKIWKDSYCAMHHPERIAAKEKEQDAAKREHLAYKEERSKWQQSTTRAEIAVAIMPAIIQALIQQRPPGNRDDLQQISFDAVYLTGKTVDCMLNYFPGVTNLSREA